MYPLQMGTKYSLRIFVGELVALNMNRADQRHKQYCE